MGRDSRVSDSFRSLAGLRIVFLFFSLSRGGPGVNGLPELRGEEEKREEARWRRAWGKGVAADGRASLSFPSSSLSLFSPPLSDFESSSCFCFFTSPAFLFSKFLFFSKRCVISTEEWL